MKIKSVQDIPERRLFHGTDTKNVDSICKYNFDLRKPKTNGRTFGNGKTATAMNHVCVIII